MKLSFPTGSMGKSLGAIFIAIPLIVLVSSALCLLGPSGLKFWIAICSFALFTIYFFPTFIAWDISDRLTDIEKLKKENKKLDKISIKHQSFWTIFVINLLFGWSILGWIIAFGMAHGQSDSNIPSEFQELLQPKTPNIESRLTEVGSLLSKGLISQAEADIRRDAILKNVN